MRALPCAPAQFDRIVSRHAIHNVPTRAGRDDAIAEIVRVLAPGGAVLISDIGHVPRYAGLLREGGLDVTLERRAIDVFWAVVSCGGIRPARLVATCPRTPAPQGETHRASCG